MFDKRTYHIWIAITFVLVLETNAQKTLWDENPANSELIIDSLEITLVNHSGRSRMRVLNRLAELYWLIDPDQTIKYASEAFQLSKQFSDPPQEGLALINLCQGYLFNDLYDKALNYGLKSLKIREQLEDQYDIAFTLRTLGWLYYDIRNYDKALEYHEKVLALHLQIENPERIAYSFNSIGLIYTKMGDHNKALSFFTQSLNLKRPFDNQDRISETLKNMGISLHAIHEYDSAVAVLSKSLDISISIRDTYNQTEVLNELSRIYLRQKKYDQSYNTFNQARLIMEELKDNKVHLVENNQIASAYYASTGDHERALFHYQLYDSLRSEILSDKKSYKLTEMRILYEAERREAEIRILEQQQRIEKQKFSALIIGVVLIIIIAILFVGRLRSSIRKNKIIYKKTELLTMERLKNEELRSAKLQDKLEFRMKELTNLALFISQRTEVYENLSEALKNLDFIDREDFHGRIKIFLNEYAHKLNINEDIQKFNANIDNVHDEFFYRIRKEFPNLTDNDLRLAAQLRLNLSSKEISYLNSISVKSVEVSRYRLRKKLNLDKKETLTDFLMTF